MLPLGWIRPATVNTWFYILVVIPFHFACQQNGILARTRGLVANHETVYIQEHGSGDSVDR